MNPIEFGARQAVVNCLGVKGGENVVVITDHEKERFADAIIKEAQKAGGVVRKFVMEDFGPRPDDGKNPLRFPKEIGDALSKAHVSFFVAGCKTGELDSFRKPIFDYIYGKTLRHGHMPNFTEIMMSMGMAADYTKIQELSKKVHDIASEAKKIHVTAPAGSDFTASFDPKYKWIIFDGVIQPGQWKNLPDGEVFGAPVSAEGLVVVDGCLGDFFTQKYGDIGNTPVRYELVGGRCRKGSVACENAELKMEFEKHTFETDENSDRLGELGIGTNLAVTKLIGNLLQDEKFPGVHLALGNPYPDMTGAEWKSSAHNDGVIKNPTVVVDGKTIMKDGKFTI